MLLHSYFTHTLLLYSCFTHALLMTHSYCATHWSVSLILYCFTHALLMLYSWLTHTALHTTHSYFTHTLLLHSCFTHALLMTHPYCATHWSVSLILYLRCSRAQSTEHRQIVSFFPNCFRAFFLWCFFSPPYCFFFLTDLLLIHSAPEHRQLLSCLLPAYAFLLHWNHDLCSD
jgi:hypothetical protein